MFDDYVEHTSGPPALSAATRSVSQLQYEGFEATPKEDERALYFEDADGGLSNPEVTEMPIFELGSVQHTLPAPLVHLTVASNLLTMALRSNVLQRIDLSPNASAITTITLPAKKSTPADNLTVYKIFSDPTGKHLLITTEQGDNFYCYEGWQRARQLSKMRLVVESVAWNTVPNPQFNYPKTSTREILVGARNGVIYEVLLDAHDDFFKSQDRYVQPVFTLPEKPPITGIRFECPTGKKAYVVVTTPNRLYQFLGPLAQKTDDMAKLFEPLFAPYRESAPKFVELGGATPYSELHLFASAAPPALSKSMAWLTAPGIYHGALNPNLSNSEVIEAPSLLPYPASSQTTPAAVPISIEVTEFHFLILFRDRLCAVGFLDERLVYEEMLPLKPGETPLGMASDPIRKTYWVFTNASLFELLIKSENRDVWSVYLRKGMFDLALQYSKTLPQRSLVNSSLADNHFKEGRYIQAAAAYAQSSKSFEEVVLAFGDAGQRDALRYFLVCKLERIAKGDLTQRMMLATWLVEFYLSKLNSLDDVIASESASHDVDNLLTERTLIEDELRQFFDTYKANLDKTTTYELILSHGRTDMFLKYASVIGDFKRVIEHHVMEEEWTNAVDVLNRQPDLQLYYQFSPVLMRNAPKETVDSWLRQPLLDPHRLIPSILQVQHSSPAQLSPTQAIRYLQSVVFTSNSTSPMIHNLLLTLLISLPTPPTDATAATTTPSDNDAPLLRFLSTAPSDPITSQPYYDLDYALRLCKQYGKLQACVHIYAKMAMWEESVDLALEMGELDLAKINADRPDDDEVLRKKLWLKVAKYVVQDKKDIKTAMQFLDNTSALKIEDILPFFPDFVIIDDFKEEICTALEGYSAHIDSLKAEMDEATRSAESIKKDIADLKNRFITVEQGDRCAVCEYPLLTRQFYVFPCQHSFHADCLIGLVKEYLPAGSLRRILALQNELLRIAAAPSEQLAQRPGSVAAPTARALQQQQAQQQQPQRALLSANFAQNGGLALNNNIVVPLAATGRVFAAAGAGLRDLIIPESLATAIGVGNWTGGRNRKNAKDGKEGKERRGEKLREELDDLLAASCPLCESVVAGLDKPFIAPGEEDKSWQL